jgi:hypothetical protein
MTLRRHSFPWLAIALPPVLAYVVFAIGPYPWPRNIAAAIPFTSIVAAAALVAVVDRIRARHGARAVLLLAAAIFVSAFSAALAWPLTSVRSGFAEMGATLGAPPRVHTLTSTEIMVYYLRRSSPQCKVVSLPLTLPGLAAYVRRGYRYAVVEAHHTSPVVWYIRDHASFRRRYRALSVYPNGEDLISTENGAPPVHPSRWEYVTLYRIDGLRLPHPNWSRFHPCDPNAIA